MGKFKSFVNKTRKSFQNGEEEKFNPVKEAKAKIAKIRLIIAGISSFVSFIPVILIILVVVVIVMIPMMIVAEVRGKLGTFMEKVGNFLTTFKFETSENIFYDNLSEEYTIYSNTKYSEDDLDIAIIAATLHYTEVIKLQYSQTQLEDSVFNDVFDPEKAKDESRFYKTASKYIGSVNSGTFLAGNLVGTKAQIACIDNPFTSSDDAAFSTEALNFPAGTEAPSDSSSNTPSPSKNELYDNFIQQMREVIDDEVGDGGSTPTIEVGGSIKFSYSAMSVLRNFVDNMGYGTDFRENSGDNNPTNDNTYDYSKVEPILEFSRAMVDYVTSGNEAVKLYLKGGEKELFSSYDFESFQKILEVSELAGYCNNDSWKIPVFGKFNDYQAFETYLVDEFFDAYLTGDNALGDAYDNLTDAEKEAQKKEWAAEVFSYRNTYASLVDEAPVYANEIFAFGIPGSSSYPILYNKETTKIKITSPYGVSRNITTGGVTRIGIHKGIDLVVSNLSDGANISSGHLIVSVADGLVKSAGYDSVSGNFVRVQHDLTGDGIFDVETLYCHLLRTPVVRSGDPVLGGQQLGQLGSTGFSTGAHLHFGLYDVTGDSMDPTDFLEKLALNVSGQSKTIMKVGIFTDTQISDYNTVITNAVTLAGPQTREATTAAIKFLAFNLPSKVPYKAGGEYTATGINPNWGTDGDGLSNLGLLKWGLFNAGFETTSIANLNTTYLTNNKTDWRTAITSGSIKIGDLAYNSSGDFGYITSITSGIYQVVYMDSVSGGSKIENIDSLSSKYSYVVSMDNFYNGN